MDATTSRWARALHVDAHGRQLAVGDGLRVSRPIRVINGQVQRDNGNIIPVFTPGVSRVQNWLSVQGAQIDLTTVSMYVNDRWTINEHFNVNLGLRYERHTSNTTQAGIVTPESSAFVPRLGLTFDPSGDGTWVLQGTYAHYAGKASETQFADNTNVGTPSLVLGQYSGPPARGSTSRPASIRRTTPPSAAASHFERVPRRGPGDPGHTRVDRTGRPPARSTGRHEGPLRQPHVDNF
jgi:hypothetical protein